MNSTHRVITDTKMKFSITNIKCFLLNYISKKKAEIDKDIKY